MNKLTCGCEYVDSLILSFCETHKYPGPESHKDGKGIIIRDLESQIQRFKADLCSVINTKNEIRKEAHEFFLQIEGMKKNFNDILLTSIRGDILVDDKTDKRGRILSKVYEIAASALGGPPPDKSVIEEYAAEMDRLNRLISEHQRALRKVDQCCGCLGYEDRFKALDRGTPDPKCEDCNREQYRCDCPDKQQQTEKRKCPVCRGGSPVLCSACMGSGLER